jgi:alpha-tubulin suppressor-like RCC1 family protein
MIDIFFGLKHAIALLDNGSVFSWGDGTYGELGHGRLTMVNEPLEIKFFREESI